FSCLSRQVASAMAEFSGTHFLFKKKPTRPVFTITADGWYCRAPREPPEPPTPPAPLVPPAPPVPPSPPAPPAPPNPPPLETLRNRPMLQLCQHLPATFNELLEEIERDKPQHEYNEASAPAPRWGEPVDCAWNESAVGIDDDVDAEGTEGDKGTDADDKTGTEDVAEQCTKFWEFFRNNRREREIKMTWIINADQTPLWLEMPATTTVDHMGERSVPIRSTGYQKQHVTVMLACTADGVKLKPWVFFKHKTVPKGDFPKAVNLKKPPPEVVLRWISRAWKAVPTDLNKKAFLSGGISNALDESDDNLAMAHRRGQLSHEVDVDDDITANSFWGKNCPKPESDNED
ncbi:unnamed protein product, partial [Closterium sp. NIES-53]